QRVRRQRRIQHHLALQLCRRQRQIPLPHPLVTVSAASRPSFIIITRNPHPVLAQLLDQQGVKYTLAVLPRSGLVVITPDRAVPPPLSSRPRRRLPVLILSSRA
ncbi:MAG: hypothetical protein ACXWQZ_14275, partial [Ktedonobacterales bacterium]